MKSPKTGVCGEINHLGGPEHERVLPLYQTGQFSDYFHAWIQTGAFRVDAVSTKPVFNTFHISLISDALCSKDPDRYRMRPQAASHNYGGCIDGLY